MKFVDKLVVRRLDNLREKNLIESDICARVGLALHKDADSGNSAARIAVNMVAAFFLTCAAVLFVCYNWREFGLFWQTAISVAPVFVFLILGVFVIAKKRESRLWNDIACVSGFGAVYACMLGMCMAYNLPDKNIGAFYILFTMFIPLVFRSSIGAFLLSITLFSFAETSFAGIYRLPNDCFDLYMLLVAVIAVVAEFYFLIIRNYSARNIFEVIVSYAASIFTPFALLFPIMTICDSGTGYAFSILLYAAVFSFGVALYKKRSAVLVNGFLIGGAIFLSISMFFLSFGFGDRFALYFQKGFGMEYIPIFAAFWIIVVAAAVAIIRNLVEGGTKIILAPCVAFLSFVPPLFCDGKFPKDIALYISNAAIIIFALSLFIKGVREKSSVFINGGIALFIAYAIARSINSDIPMYWRATGFLLLGFLALVFNIVWGKVSRPKI